MTNIKLLSQSKCFNGEVRRYSHQSNVLDCEMKFHVYIPAKSSSSPSVLWFLSGLTCTDENFITKSGVTKYASESNLFIVCPDTSPRGTNIEGEHDSWDFGSGAGFYVDATVEKWSKNYNMYSYVTKELFDLVNQEFEVNKDNHSIFGHSMGGHGALTCAMRNPSKYKSVSGFSPICNPMNVPWGKKNFTGYLGEDQSKWCQYDSSYLAKQYQGPLLNILIDQGTADEFLESNLHPQALIESANQNKDHINLELRFQDGYNHNYYFISTFIEDHIKFHKKYL
eukprot:gene4503-5616_t